MSYMIHCIICYILHIIYIYTYISYMLGPCYKFGPGPKWDLGPLARPQGLGCVGGAGGSREKHVFVLQVFVGGMGELLFFEKKWEKNIGRSKYQKNLMVGYRLC